MLATKRRAPDGPARYGDSVVEPKPDLAGAILKLRGEIEAFIDGKLAELKRSESGASLPVEVLRQSLTRGDSCFCRVAMNILAEQSNV
jgi:hypothetical protein